MASNIVEEDDQYTEEEVEEVVEVEEDDDENIEDIDEKQSLLNSVPTVTTPPKKPAPLSKGRNKVTPSKEVAGMKMRSPSDPSPLTPTKNPFNTFGKWDAKTLSEITIKFPDLTNKDESTNDLTRNNRQEARYWKAPVVFKYESFASDTIRIDNVQIPYMPGVRNYGTSFVYVCLPPDLGSATVAAGKLKRPTMIFEEKLVPDKQRWWKAANGLERVFGSIDAKTRNFVPKPLDSIFEATSKGIIANLVVRFICKANTDNFESLKPTTICKVVVEIVRGYIIDIDVDVEGPIRIVKEKKKIEPLATSSDVATDDLSRRLAQLGI